MMLGKRLSEFTETWQLVMFAEEFDTKFPPNEWHGGAMGLVRVSNYLALCQLIERVATEDE